VAITRSDMPVRMMPNPTITAAQAAIEPTSQPSMISERRPTISS
jgi:hypothetical protein